MEREKQRALWVFLPISPVQLPRMSGTWSPLSSYRRKPAGALASARGKRTPLSPLHTPAHLRTHAHMRALADPSLRRAFPPPVSGLTGRGSPGIAPGFPPDLPAAHCCGFPAGPHRSAASRPRPLSGGVTPPPRARLGAADQPGGWPASEGAHTGRPRPERGLWPLGRPSSSCPPLRPEG